MAFATLFVFIYLTLVEVYLIQGRVQKGGGDIGISEKQIVSNGLVLHIHMIVSPSLLILILLAKGHKMQ